jgi:hypothetical protein
MLSIGQLAERTGVSVETLRAWERRYGVLRPVRSRGGHRRYSAADVERVMWLINRLTSGERIAQAAGSLCLVDEFRRPRLDHGIMSQELVAAARDGDLLKLEADLDRVFASLPITLALDSLVFPALVELGSCWAGGEENVTAEHLLSESVARRLSSRFGALRPVDGDTLLICCADGDNHVLGALAFAVLAATDGWTVAYLAGSTPLPEAARLGTMLAAKALVVVCTMPEPAGVALDYVTRSAPGLPWVFTGPATAAWGEVREGVSVWGPSLDEAREASQTLQSCRRTG